MGIERSFCPGRLVMGVLRSKDLDLAPIEAALEQLFGPIDYRGPEFPFSYSDYYIEEMGPGISRTFYSFSRLFNPEELAAAKLATDRIEAEFAQSAGNLPVSDQSPATQDLSPVPAADPAAGSRGGRRRVNLDPGFLSLGGFILATTKDRAHRIPLREGIYAELTLYYKGGGFLPLPWTYADWQSPPYLAVLMELRSRLKAELKAENLLH